MFTPTLRPAFPVCAFRDPSFHASGVISVDNFFSHREQTMSRLRVSMEGFGSFDVTTHVAEKLVIVHSKDRLCGRKSHRSISTERAT